MNCSRNNRLAHGGIWERALSRGEFKYRVEEARGGSEGEKERKGESRLMEVSRRPVTPRYIYDARRGAEERFELRDNDLAMQI